MSIEILFYLIILIVVRLTIYLIENQSLVIFLSLIEKKSHRQVENNLLYLFSPINQNI